MCSNLWRTLHLTAPLITREIRSDRRSHKPENIGRSPRPVFIHLTTAIISHSNMMFERDSSDMEDNNDKKDDKKYAKKRFDGGDI